MMRDMRDDVRCESMMRDERRRMTSKREITFTVNRILPRSFQFFAS
jgi:hypothetical protein